MSTRHDDPPRNRQPFDEGLPLAVPASLEKSEAKRRNLDYGRSLVKDRSFEKRLPLKGLVVVILVAAALAVRIFLG